MVEFLETYKNAYTFKMVEFSETYKNTYTFTMVKFTAGEKYRLGIYLGVKYTIGEYTVGDGNNIPAGSSQFLLL